MAIIKYRRNQSSPLSCDDLDDNFDALRERSNHLGTQLASTISDLRTTVQGYDFIIALQQCCDNLNQQLVDLQVSVFGDGELSTLINALQSELFQDLSAIQTDLNALKNRVTTAEGNISAINTSISSLSNSVVNLQNTKANINNPNFTGIPTAPTPISGSGSTQIATVGYVNSVAAGVTIPSSIPIGAILEYSAPSIADSDYVIANGQAISRSAYAEYFALVGTIYGIGDGSSTFNVPDKRDRVGIGTNSTFPLGAKGGEVSHTLTQDQMPGHTHASNAHSHTVNDLGHFHSLYCWNSTQSDGVSDGFLRVGDIAVAGELEGPNDYLTTNLDGNKLIDSSTTGVSVNSSTITILNTGGGSPHNNMQPYIALNYIVKVR